MINFEEIKKFRSFYFSGIAGTGMKPLAKFFSASGYTVAGADLNTEFFPELKEYGIKVYDTHDGKRLKNFDALVVSSSIIKRPNETAISPTHPAMRSARSRTRSPSKESATSLVTRVVILHTFNITGVVDPG